MLNLTERAKKIDKLVPYLTRIQDLMYLIHWDIEIQVEAPPAPDALALIDPHHSQNSAHIWFHDDFFEESPDQQRKIVVHELLHLHQAHYLHQVDHLSSEIGKTAWDLWEAGFRRENEYATDALSKVIAPHFPLPTDLPKLEEGK